MRTAPISFTLTVYALGAFIASLPLAGQTSPAGKSAPAQTERLPDMMLTPARIVIPSLSNPLYLGEESLLAVTLKGPTPRLISTEQSTLGYGDLFSSIQSSYVEAELERHEDGQTYVRIVPQRPGKLQIDVDAVFSDGGYDKAAITVDVIARKPPVKLEGDFLLKNVYRILMDLSERGRSKYLRLSATYTGVKDTLPIQSDQAQFKLAMSKDAPPIDFDPKTLQIKALRTGHALIEALYGGLSLRTCVQVRESRDGYDPSDCRELSAIAENPSQLPQRPFESKLPYSSDDSRTGRFLADDRVELVVPTQPLHIAENNAIAFHVRGPAVARIDCHPLNESLPCYPWKGEWQQGSSATSLPLQHNGDGTVTISLFPMEFGTHEFSFLIFFVDGGVALKKLTVETDAGNVRPVSIGQYCDRDFPDKNLPLQLVPPKDGQQDFRGKTTLIPWVCYEGVRGFASPPATAVKYQIRTETKEPPIELDPATGIVKALRPGQALIQQTFAGVSFDSCVVVAPLEEPDASNCRKLRAKYGTPLPPLKFHVEAPVTADAPTHPEPGRMGGIAPTIELAGKSPPLPAVDAIAGATLSPNVRDRFNADERLTFLTFGLVAELGQPTRLPIRLTGPAVLSVKIEQELVRFQAKLGAIPYEDPAFMEEQNADRIGRAADGSPYLHILPLRTITTEFRVSILFADGGVATRTVRVPVKLPVGATPHLVNGLDGSMRGLEFEAKTLHLSLSQPSTRNLSPFIYFDNPRITVALDPAKVEYSLKGGGGDPVVQLDSETGTITALHIGHALVKARYSGAESETCIVVVNDVTDSDDSNCQELHSPDSPHSP